MNIKIREEIIYVNNKFAYDAKQRPLGRGQFGVVYKGFEIATKSPVAIKIVFKSFDSEMNGLYEREMMILNKLKGGNFVNGLGTFQTETQFYMIMEFCEGGSLESKLEERKRLPEKECLSIVHQIANAFFTLTTEGIKDKHGQKLVLIHRDIKPANILFSGGKVKVTDFGLAKLISEINSHNKSFHTRVGTPVYMSPQVLENNQRFSTKCDVFSTGVVLYEMLHGVTPWMMLNAGTSIALYLSKLPLLTYSSALDPQTISLLKGMLEISEEKRFHWGQVYTHPAFSKILPALKELGRAGTMRIDREQEIDRQTEFFPKNNIFRRKIIDEAGPKNYYAFADQMSIAEREKAIEKPIISAQKKVDEVILKHGDERAKTPIMGDYKGKFFGLNQLASRNENLIKDIIAKYAPTNKKKEGVESSDDVLKNETDENIAFRRYDYKPPVTPKTDVHNGIILNHIYRTDQLTLVNPYLKRGLTARDMTPGKGKENPKLSPDERIATFLAKENDSRQNTTREDKEKMLIGMHGLNTLTPYNNNIKKKDAAPYTPTKGNDRLRNHTFTNEEEYNLQINKGTDTSEKHPNERYFRRTIFNASPCRENFTPRGRELPVFPSESPHDKTIIFLPKDLRTITPDKNVDGTKFEVRRERSYTLQKIAEDKERKIQKIDILPPLNHKSPIKMRNDNACREQQGPKSRIEILFHYRSPNTSDFLYINEKRTVKILTEEN